MNGRQGRLVMETRYSHIQIVEKSRILQSTKAVVISNVPQRKTENYEAYAVFLKGYSQVEKCKDEGFTKLSAKGVMKQITEILQLANFKYCTANADKSRSKNSYIFAEGMFCEVVRFVECCPEAYPHCDCSRSVLLHPKKTKGMQR